ncbi:MAG: ABC transporter substrate-binding protein, partial [Candidatus Cloacimonadota bacterium]|nr:ABC transporter substrate-binding protein [Candidatus Cloacimonadota bacterium]
MKKIVVSGISKWFFASGFFIVLIALSLIIFSFLYNPFQKDKVSSQNKICKISPLKNIPDRKEILFGCSISMTGCYKVEGKNVVQGYNLWKDYSNNKGGIKIGGNNYKIRIIYYDDKSDLELMKKNMTKLITEDEVDFILGKGEV